MIMDMNHPDVNCYVVVNGQGGEIPYVTRFDTETKEVTMYLYDSENFSMYGEDDKPISVTVKVPKAQLVRLMDNGKPVELPSEKLNGNQA